MVKINGQDVEFSMLNVDNVRAYQAALGSMQAKEKKIKSSGKPYLELLEDLINLLRDFFKDCTGTDVLSDVRNYKEAQDIYYQFLMDIKKEAEAVNAPYSADRIR